jgi:hypothetical protein
MGQLFLCVRDFFVCAQLFLVGWCVRLGRICCCDRTGLLCCDRMRLLCCDGIVIL